MTVIDSLYEGAIHLSSTLVVKRDDLALKDETVDSIRNFERFMSLMNGAVTIFDFAYLDYDLMMEVFNDHVKVTIYMNDRNQIPEERRYEVLEKHRKRYYEQYVETNNYYRNLFGLPNMEDNVFIYVKDVQGVRENVPIHLLDLFELSILEVNNKIKELIVKYPEKVYLRYLGNNKIDFVKARTASHLDIIRISDAVDSKIKEMFIREYYIARKFHMSTVYNPDLFLNRDYYDGFLGFMILIATIRNTISVDSLFMDNEELFNSVLKSYDLYDYFKDLPLVQKRKLVENIDNLLTYSGSDKVLIDISKIFGYDTKINRYYMVKRHQTDNNGKPIFPKLEDGTPDYDLMYKLDFLKVDVQSDRIDLATDKFIDFKTVTDRDPLWQLEPDYLTMLKSEEFNLDISKYVSVESAYEITQLVFEMSYFLNLLIDNRLYTSGIKATNMYSALASSDLFTYIMFCFSLMCKRYDFEGNINYQPADIAALLKFNLEDVINDIVAINKEYRLNINVNDFLLMNNPSAALSANQIVEVYKYNRDVYNRLNEAINKTDNLQKYLGLSKIKKLLFVSTNLTKTFTMSNGMRAATYYEMLRDIDISLAVKVDNVIEDADLDDLIQYCLEKLQSLFEDSGLKFLFLNTPDMQDRTLKNYFTKMVKLFISSTTDLDTFDMIYVISGEDGVIRLFDSFVIIPETYFKDAVRVTDRIRMQKRIVIQDHVTVDDFLTNI